MTYGGRSNRNDMRRKDKQITDDATLEVILRKADVCRVAMCDGDEPYLVPVNFGYRDRALFIHSAREGRKIEILSRNNRVSFEAETDVEIVRGDSACDWGARYRSVIGAGRARFLEDRKEKEEALDIIMRKYSGAGEYAYSPAKVDAITVIRVDIETMCGKKSGME